MTQHSSHVRHPVRKLPTKEQVAYAARSQAQYETTIDDGENDYELEHDNAYYQTRLPTSARRYQEYKISPEQIYQSGNQRLHLRYVDVPKRKSRQAQLPPERERQTDEVETTPPKSTHRKRSIHPLLYLGVGMIAMLALVVIVFSGWNWVQIKMDDIQYGRPRTYQSDFVVGHNDSPANPSHFIAINLNRHVQVIEIPGGDSTKERTFQITTLFGDGEDLTPVTLSFRDVNGDGKPDMLIHIQDQTLVMINDNGTFRPAKPGEVKGLL